MLIDILRTVIKAGEDERSRSRKAAQASGRARLFGWVISILAVVDLILFWRGFFTGGAMLGIVLVALRFLLRASLSDVAEAERDAASAANTRASETAAMHPFDRAMRRFNLAGRYGLASFLGVATAVFFLAGVLTLVGFMTDFLRDSGYFPVRERTEATVLARVEKCRIRGANGVPDSYVDAALCELRRDDGRRREIAPFLTLRFALPDGTVHTMEARQRDVARGRAAAGDRLPVTYDPDNPDDVRWRKPNYLTTVRASLVVPFVMLVLAYGAARWRRRLLGEPSPAGRIVERARQQREARNIGKDDRRMPVKPGPLPMRDDRPSVATFMTGPRARQGRPGSGVKA